eukprot:TRINITY_DN6263_c0_g1_i1.p1 TRINITY_DN6263_c0_g1~~TRINITY_DN6263_c0_g1_i1.p1  ORF type:complete len:367 (-),score=88.09 TRINITY_DN6263_c0_g1_i1:1155-2147(-)
MASAELRANAAANANRIRELENMLHTKRRELERLHSAKRQRSRSVSPPVSVCTTPLTSPRTIDYVKHSPREMAARGSHWSFAEKARFEAALHRYGPFAWDHIIRAVGTRSEKQVKAYAARYRRRKKLAAKAQQEAVRAFATAQLNAAAAAANHSLGVATGARARDARKSEPRLATIMPADFCGAAGVHVRSDGGAPFGCKLGLGSAPQVGDWGAAPFREAARQYAPREWRLNESAECMAMNTEEQEEAAAAEAEGATETSTMESASNDESTECAFFGGDVDEADGLADMVKAATEEMSLGSTLLQDDAEWQVTDSLGGELLPDALLGGTL